MTTESEPHSGASNVDPRVVKAFGEEWGRFTQAKLSDQERRTGFASYFSLFPWDRLASGAVGADIGCGSGRWAIEVAPRVGDLHCIDPSDAALAVARRNLDSLKNVTFHTAHAGALPFPDAYLDFAYSLGVLHHVPDTAAALRSIGRKLKPGAPFLIYLYYAFDNRPRWFRLLWKVSDWARHVISRLPFKLRYAISQCLAVTVYWPMARIARFLDRAGRLPANWPLAQYRNSTFYAMRTDALDRFGTRLEHRFTQAQIQSLLHDAGFVEVTFSDAPPYWCALTFRGA